MSQNPIQKYKISKWMKYEGPLVWKGTFFDTPIHPISDMDSELKLNSGLILSKNITSNYIVGVIICLNWWYFAQISWNMTLFLKIFWSDLIKTNLCHFQPILTNFSQFKPISATGLDFFNKSRLFSNPGIWTFFHRWNI